MDIQLKLKTKSSSVIAGFLISVYLYIVVTRVDGLLAYGDNLKLIS